MNIYGLVILITLLASYLLNIITNILNMKSLQRDLPPEFEDTYDPTQYARSQDYTRTNIKFGFITSNFNLALIIIFWFSGGFNYLDLAVRSFHLAGIWTGLIYIGILLLLKSFLSIPFNVYHTFVIEEKFGFNRTTVKTYLLDMIKTFFLSIIIGAPLLAGLLYFFEHTGEYAWFYCWIATTLFLLFVQYISPTWIMPLFNKFTPMEEGELKSTILSYAKSVQFPLKGIYVMDGSKRSSKSNAFFTGFGKNKRIALFDTLIEKHTVAELVSILAHEIGHYKKKHIIKTMLMGIVHTGIIFYLLSIFLNHRGLFDAFYMDHMSVYAGLLFFSMLYAPIEIILSIFLQMFSRKNEYEADRFAVETTKNNSGFISALKKLSVHNLSNLTPHPLYVFLNYSHPPVLKRIDTIRNLEVTKVP